MPHKRLRPQPDTRNKIEKILQVVIAALCVFYLCVAMIFKPVLANDALNGMLSLHNYLNNGGWNQNLVLSNDLSHITSNQLTWWSPGQYVLPFLVSKALFVNIGTAVIILIFSAVICGCYFYYKIFKLSSINNRIVLYALLVLLLERFINIYIIQYYSSDIFLFFYTPFYIFTYYRLLQNYRHQTILKVILLTVLNAGGLFLKNSFILFELAANGFLVIEYLFNSNNAGKETQVSTGDIALWKKLSILLPFVVANVVNYFFFLRLGHNPSSGRGILLSFSNVLTGVFLPVVQTLFSSLSLYSLYGNFYDKVNLSNTAADAIMVIVLLIIAYVVYRQRSIITELFKKDLFSRFVIITAGINVLIWFTFIIKQSYILNEDRLYLPVSILVFPFLLSIALRSGSVVKYLYFILVGCSVLYGVFSFANRVKQYAINGSVWSKDKNLNGFKVYSNHKNDDPTLKEISDVITKKYPDAYVVVTGTSLAFELNVSNKFILMPVLPARDTSNSKPGANFIVLVEVGQDKLPVGLKKVYSLRKFEIYKPD